MRKIYDPKGKKKTHEYCVHAQDLEFKKGLDGELFGWSLVLIRCARTGRRHEYYTECCPHYREGK